MRRGSLSPHKDVLISIDPPGGPALGSDLGERSRNLYKHSLVRIEYKNIITAIDTPNRVRSSWHPAYIDAG